MKTGRVTLKSRTGYVAGIPWRCVASRFLVLLFNLTTTPHISLSTTPSSTRTGLGRIVQTTNNLFGYVSDSSLTSWSQSCVTLPHAKRVQEDDTINQAARQPSPLPLRPVQETGLATCARDKHETSQKQAKDSRLPRTVTYIIGYLEKQERNGAETGKPRSTYIL